MLVGPSCDCDRIRILLPTPQGIEPLSVAWDNNALTRYERYGAAMWEGEKLGVSGTEP